MQSLFCPFFLHCILESCFRVNAKYVQLQEMGFFQEKYHNCATILAYYKSFLL